MRTFTRRRFAKGTSVIMRVYRLMGYYVRRSISTTRSRSVWKSARSFALRHPLTSTLTTMKSCATTRSSTHFGDVSVRGASISGCAVGSLATGGGIMGCSTTPHSCTITRSCSIVAVLTKRSPSAGTRAASTLSWNEAVVGNLFYTLREYIFVIGKRWVVFVIPATRATEV